MDKIINKGLFLMKILILLVAFTVTLYILFIRMDIYELSALSLFPIFIPSLLLLIIFIFGIISNTKINLHYFDLFINKIEIMLYLTFISNILLIIYEKKKKIHS